MKKNIVMYFEENYGFGHLCMLLHMYKSLHKHAKIILLTSCNIPRDFFEDISVVEIPTSKDYTKKGTAQRIHVISNILSHFPPDVFIIDYFPFGKFPTRYEVRYIISQVKHNNGKVYTFMRDIYIGEPCVSSREYETCKTEIKESLGGPFSQELNFSQDRVLYLLHRMKKGKMLRVNLFLEYYLSEGLIDGVFVFGDDSIHKLESEFLLPNELHKKFTYIGYPVSSLNRRHNCERKSTKRILVSSGGNVTSKEQFFQLLVCLSQIPGYDVDIFLGDFVEQDYRNSLKTHFASLPSMQIYSFIPDFRSQLSKYDCYFGFGGYGTFLDILYEGIPAFIIPNFDDGIFAHRRLEHENRVKIFSGKANVFLLTDITVGNITYLLSQEYTFHGDIKLANIHDMQWIVDF